MTIHFTMAMDGLHRDIVAMCSKVEENISAAVKGLQQRSGELAAELKVRDGEINDLDIHIEEECLRILALYHPVANDLRRVTAVLKIAGELERVGDIAVNLANRAASISLFPEFPMPPMLSEMTDKALTMLHQSIDAYVDLDATVARAVCAADDEVDRLNVVLLERVRDEITQDVKVTEPGMHLFSAIRQIERVADHATNIAEDVVYLVEGIIIRHGGGGDTKSKTT
ncbi:MAG: phosphate signaling complex protein PhoU [Fuerstiella sp.]